MGPYCKFCDNRCFVYLPMATPPHILKAYGTNTIIATCRGGQKFEKEKIGYCYNDIQEAIAFSLSINQEPWDSKTVQGKCQDIFPDDWGLTGQK